MRQFPVARLIDAPAPSDFLLVELAPAIIGGKRLAFCFELVDLAARARLMSIDSPCLQKPGTADLLALGIKHHSRQQRVHAPVKPKDVLDRAPVSKPRFWYLDDEVEHRDPASIYSNMFSESRSHARPL